MKKSEFKEIERDYLERRKSLEKISIGDLVWEEVCRFVDNDYHPAVVKSVNIDEDYIDVIDVSDGNKEKEYACFKTREEMLKMGFTEKLLQKEYEKYADVIKSVRQ